MTFVNCFYSTITHSFRSMPYMDSC
ncbi:CRISPR-associated DxTHG motif protein [Mycobacterium tuberculosis]|nr:CRISPR-associated DxTHG motif protein [Mycobacterium tuberculosis]